MSVVPFQAVKAAIVNNAFMSRLSNTSTVGRVDLNKPTGSGAQITDVQQVVNNFITVTGMVDQNNSSLNYTATYVADGSSLKQAVESLDGQLVSTQGQVTTNSGRLTAIESAASSFSGNKTFVNDVTVQGVLTVNGTLTALNTTNTEISDKNITLNKGGNDATSETAGFTVERTTTNAAFQFDNALASKFKLGLVSALYEVLVSGVAQTVTGVKDFLSGIKADVISESTSAAGVTIDGLLIKDGGVLAYDNHIASTSNPHSTTATQVGLGNVTNDAQLTRAAGDLNSFTEKVTPVNNDIVLIEDSADSFNKKKIKLLNLLGGGGGGGAGSLVWNAPEGSGAVLTEEFGFKNYAFEKDADQQLVALVQVPESYVAGFQPLIKTVSYCDSANAHALQVTAYLIKPGVDSPGSTVNSNVLTSADLGLAGSGILSTANVALSNSSGQINSVAIAPLDYIKIVIKREAPSVTEATEDVKVIFGSMGVKFA